VAGYLVYYRTQVSPPFTISDYQLSEMVLKDNAVNQSLLNIELDTGIENYWVSLGFLHMDPVRSNEFLNMRSVDYGGEYFLFTNAGKTMKQPIFRLEIVVSSKHHDVSIRPNG